MNKDEPLAMTKPKSKLSLGRRPYIPEATGNNVIGPTVPVLGAQREIKAIVDAKRDKSPGEQPWHKGLMVCVVGQMSDRINPKKGCYVYGILGASVPSPSQTATCVMQDGSYRTFSNSEFVAGIERIGTEPFASKCPVSRLQGWLRDKSAQPNIFMLELAQLQLHFLTEQERVMNEKDGDAGSDGQEPRNTNAAESSAVTVKKVRNPPREQLVIEVSSESDDEIPRTTETQVKSEVKVKVESSTVALLRQQMGKMQKKIDAMQPRCQHRTPKPPQKKQCLSSQVTSNDVG
jgi:hypothetical protein